MFTQGYDATVNVAEPSLTSNLVVSSAHLMYSIRPTVYWKLAFDIDGIISLYTTFNTPFSANYSYTEQVTATGQSVSYLRHLGTSCGSSQTVTVQGTADSMGLDVISYPLSVPLDVATGEEVLANNAGTQCISSDSISVVTGSASHMSGVSIAKFIGVASISLFLFFMF